MPDTILDLTAQIVSAHVSKNAVPADQLPSLISQVRQALATVGQTPVECKPCGICCVGEKVGLCRFTSSASSVASNSRRSSGT